MMKYSLRVSAVLLALMLLSGCSGTLVPATTKDLTGTSPVASLPATATPVASVVTPAATEAPAATATAEPTAQPTASPTAKPQLQVEFNPYVLPMDSKTFLGKNYKDYKRVVDAILAHQEKVTFDSVKGVPDILSCLYADFPLHFLINYDPVTDKKHRTLTLVYQYDAKDHEAIVKAFEARVTDVITATVDPQYNQFEQILALYRFTAQNIAYKNGDDVSPYNALMNGVGICQSYDGVLRFLLLQLGIDGLSGNAFVTDGQAHVWSMVKIGGAWFHLDPTFENSTTGGAGLTYFGMNDGRRTDSGVVMPISTGVNDWWKPKAPACTDDRFAAFNGVTRWELDSAAHRLSLYYKDSAEPVIFDTVKLAVIQ